MRDERLIWEEAARVAEAYATVVSNGDQPNISIDPTVSALDAALAIANSLRERAALAGCK